MDRAIILTLLLLAGAPVARAQTPAPIRIGAIVDQSSVFSGADGDGSILGARMAVEDFGPVLGRPVELLTADHQNKPDIGAGIAREWFATRGVTAIAGGANSAVAFAIQDLARQQGHVFLNVNGTSSDLSDKACSPNSVYWGIDSYALAKVTGRYVTQHGGHSWFFVTSDYTFGHALQRDTEKAVRDAGGTVAGATMHPFNNPDFAGQILTAQAAPSDVVAFADSGDDFTNAMKAAASFGLAQSGRKLVGLLVFMTNLEALDPQESQGLSFATMGEWTSTPAILAWSRKFMARNAQHVPPVPGQMGMYGAVHHYLRAVQAAGTTDAAAVMAKMKSMPTDDFATAGGTIRADGRLMVPVHVNVIKSPDEVHFPFDLVKEVATIPAVDAFRPALESQCPLLK